MLDELNPLQPDDTCPGITDPRVFNEHNTSLVNGDIVWCPDLCTAIVFVTEQ